MGKRGTEGRFNDLHRHITDKYIERVTSEDVTVSELKAAAEWCIKNDVNAPALEGGALDSLRQMLPKIEAEDVKEYLNA